MERLASSDLRSLLEFGRMTQSMVTPSPAAARELVLRSLCSFVHGDVGVLTEAPAGRLVTHATDPALGSARDAARELWLQCQTRGEHPVVAYWDRTGDGRAVMLSDFLDARALHRTELYQVFWRPFAVEHAIGTRVRLSVGLLDLASYRTSRDFSDRDRLVLDELRFHATRLLRRAEVHDLVVASTGAFGLTSREAEILAWVARGGTNADIGAALFLAPGTVKKHLDSIYHKVGVRTRSQAASVVLSVGYTTGRSVDASTPGEMARTIPGLTHREGEALAWVALGKTNVEIGTLMGIAPDTAKQHLDHVYRKLDVATRTAAVAQLVAANAVA